MELLVVLKVVKKAEVQEDNIDVGDLTEEMAEAIGAEDIGADNNDDVVLARQEKEGEEFDGSVFAKVSNHMSI